MATPIKAAAPKPWQQLKAQFQAASPKQHQARAFAIHHHQLKAAQPSIQAAMASPFSLGRICKQKREEEICNSKVHTARAQAVLCPAHHRASSVLLSAQTRAQP
jgi:hypothetical protein